MILRYADPIIRSESGLHSRVRPIALALAGPVALFLIVVGFFWKLVLTKQFSWLESFDIADQVVPWLNYQAQQFHLHTFPMWDPFLFGGQSLIGQGQPGAAYPLNWILFSLPLRDGHIDFDILNWYFLSIHYLAALFCYFLCRDLGRSRIACVLAGTAFGLGGYIGNTDWPQMINGAIWGPLVFLFLFRVARGVRPIASAAFCGVFLGMSWLSGHHQIPIFLTLATAGVWLYFMNRSLLLPTAVFAVFFICAGALQTWPAFEYGHLALRWSGSQHDPLSWNQPVPYTVHQEFSLSPIHLIGLLIPGYGQAVSAYVGVVGLALSGLALFSCWKTREVRILFSVGVAGLFLALAKNDVLHGILYSVVPLVEKARSPGTAIYLFHFAIAVLLAFGLDAVLISAERPVLRRLAAMLCGLGALVSGIVFAVDLARGRSWGFDDRVMLSALAAFGLAALMYRARRDTTSLLPVLIIGLYMLELGNQTLYWLPEKTDPNLGRYLKNFDATKQVADFLKHQPGPVRVDVNREAVEFNFGDWSGIDSMTGILPSLPASLCNLDFAAGRTRMLYGTNYAVGRKPTMDGQQDLFHDTSGLIVYRNPGALPRVWTVHDAVQVKDAEDARRHLEDSTFDLQKRAFGYMRPPQLEHCDGDAVRNFERGINSTTAIVEMKCRGLVVESENDAPGWVAAVDGKATPIYQAYTALRGVVVGPGMHTIEMRYRPLSVIGGAMATFSAFLGALFLWRSRLG